MERAKSIEPSASPVALVDEGESDASLERPYAPSFMDRITDWVRRLPIPAWLFYVGLFLALLLIYSGIKWADGSYPVGTFFPFHVLAVLTPVYTVAVFHFIDNAAQNTLDEFRATMNISDDQYRLLRYRFTTLPAWPAIIAAVIGGLYSLSNLLFRSPAELRASKFFISPAAIPFDILLLALSYAGAAVIVYHSVRQLRMMGRIYTDHARVDLFNLRPMYALSRLTASTAIAFGIITYAWLYINISVGNDIGLSAPSLIEPIVFTILVLVIFLLPLMGAHRLLVAEKAKAKGETSKHLKAAIAELHRKGDDSDFAGMDGIDKALDALQKEHAILDKISTWPWQPETLRGVVGAILLPIVVWAITHVLDKLWIF